MKKLILFILPALLLTTSCVDSLDDYNVNPKAATAVPGVSLVSNAQRNLIRTTTSTSVNLNPFRLYVQYWAETTYFDESIYNINTRAINGSFWTTLYRDVLRDTQEATNIISADELLNADVKANQLACIEVLNVYTWATLVNTFGNIPYTEALDFANSQPKYDDAATIYADLITRLDAAIGQMKAGADGLGNADLIYGGRMASWIKFANSLKLRLALTIADADAAKAKTMAEQAAPNVFASNAEEAKVDFLSAPPSTNPLWEQLVQSGRNDFVGTSFFIDRLNTLNDPRVGAYFKPLSGSTTTVYKGGIYGTNNNYQSFSAPGTILEDPTLPGYMLTYSETEFLLAEAAARGYSVGGTAASHYEAGVTASILTWGGTQAAATTYLAQPSVAYATAAGDYKQKIGIQKWIALYDQPVEAWTEWRRLDYPKLTKPDQALSEIPLRFPYPTVEQNLNTTSYNAAATAIGGDEVTTKIFWDKF